MKHLIDNRQSGIGVIEVMVAAVVFALGILAIIQLQGNFFQSSSAAHGQAVAMTVAEEKLEDLRGFETYTDPDADIFDFTSIAANAGGQCDTTDDNACVLTIASGATTVNNIVFSRTWTVTDYYYNAGVLTTPVPVTENVDQKDIVVTITWTDTDGSNQSLTANTIINSNSVASGGSIVSNAAGSGESPVVPYTPSTDDQVTPITVGTDSKRETLVPLATTVNGYTRTNFTAYTYNSSNELLRQEEFTNVACQCRFDGTSGTGSETYSAAHAEWDTDKDTYIDTEGDLVDGKVKGCVQGGGSNCASNPEAFCETCCQDHHDVSSVARKFDPYRSTDDYETSGNHRHYNGTTVVTSGQYLESCRFKRINGHWRAYQDWQLSNFKALPLTDLASSTVKATYATYVNAIVDAHLDESKVSGESLSSPPTLPTALDHNATSNYIDISVATDRAFLSGRGIYLDYMDATHLSTVQAKKTAMVDYLLHVPFYEVEIVDVSGWTVPTADAAALSVGPYDGPGSANDLLAGELDRQTSSATPIIVTGNVKESNSGLVDLSSAVDFNAATNPDDDEKSDTVTVCLGCSSGTASCTTPWGATVTHTGTTTAYEFASVTSPATCTSETRTCTNGSLSGSYTNASCAVIAATDCTAPWGATVTNGSSVTAWLESPPAASCTSETRTCTTGTLSGSYANQACTVVAATCDTTIKGGKAQNATDTVSVSDGTSTATCTVASGSRKYTCNTITTPLTATITITDTSSGSVLLGTQILSTICGAQTGGNF